MKRKNKTGEKLSMIEKTINEIVALRPEIMEFKESQTQQNGE
jgi:hypothetical protein